MPMHQNTVTLRYPRGYAQYDRTRFVKIVRETSHRWATQDSHLEKVQETALRNGYSTGIVVSPSLTNYR